MKGKIMLEVLVLILVMMSLAYAGSFQNGSFETGVLRNPIRFDLINSPSNVINNWTVTLGSIDYIGGEWIASDGVRSIDMSGKSPGVIEQQFDTTEGFKYNVFFDLAGNPCCLSPLMKRLEVSAAGVSQEFTFDSTGRDFNNMGWVERVFSFVAIDTTTTLRFRSLTTGDAGAAIDNVRVELASVTQPNAAVLPGSRSVVVGVPATAFATIINSDNIIATDCFIASATDISAAFTFQATDSVTNEVIGERDTPVNIPANDMQSFLIAFIPTASFDPVDVELIFDCSNAVSSAESIVGLNTLLLSASTNPVPDIVALAVTINNDGVVNVPGPTGTGLFVLATVNVGVGGTITVSADTGSVSLPISLLICETDPTSGACLPGTFPASNVITEIGANATPTFIVFVEGMDDVPFDPATNRIFVRFRDTEGAIRGTTSVAVQTQ